MNDAVIVTGCSGGIGSAIVREFSKVGYFTIGIDRVEPATDPDCFIHTDIRNIAQQESHQLELAGKIRDAIADRNLVALINNAAVQHVASLDALSLDQIRESLDVNVIAPLVLCQLCAGFLKTCSGTIVNIGSIHAKLTKPGFAAYSTSKGALESLTRALAVEMGGAVRVNAIAPAAIVTPMLLEGLGEKSSALESLTSHHPVQQLGTPLEVAALAVALTRMELPFLNGSIIDLSGGISSRLHDPC